ncbi:uncharacterized protein OCT59_016426 [Rhizophagus irregularis]|uniref:uncharacterized protein n=1 Tax=Rhizophagus irregularis TaxID=588596 RepID=UPI001A07BFE3|nr:hypothetical protein OCT59_016426 [Rhizophagus irregularis]GBC31496.2 hypothetical protein RIR_jg31989.t1 [Rhizophagus irregularis DAOM 181602=DAOM 197198]
MDICAHAPDSGWYQSWCTIKWCRSVKFVDNKKLGVIIISLFYLPDSKASELYIGRDLIGSWTFARMLLTAVGIDLD